MAKQVQTATRRSTRNKNLAVRLQKGVEEQRQQSEEEESEDAELLKDQDASMRDEKNRDAIAKLSNVPLSEEQQQLRDKVLQFCRDSLRSFSKTERPSVFLIQGDAGTGKSVVLNALFNELQRRARTEEGGKAKGKDGDSGLAGTENYLVVNHPEMLKLYHRISAQFPYIRKTDLERPTSLINRLQKERPRGHSGAMADVILVDEAHLLLSKKNAYKRFFGDNQLEELLKLGKVLVVVFDGKQSLRFDAYWNDAKLESFLAEQAASLGNGNGGALSIDRHNLGQQFRVSSAPDLQRWIQALSVERKILPRRAPMPTVALR